MVGSHISTRDPATGRELAVVEGATLVWSSGQRWGSVVAELHRFEQVDTPEFYVPEHVVVVHRAPATVVEVKVAGTYRRRTIRPGSVSLFPAGVPRQVRHGPIELFVLTLTPELVARSAVQQHGARTPTIGERHMLDDPQILQMAGALEGEANAGYPSGRVYGESIGIALAAHLVSTYATPQSTPRAHTGGMSPCALRRVIGYIDEHLADDMRLEALANVAGLSPHRFAHNFKRATGSPPHQFVIRRRVERAKPLLRDTEMTVATVTYALGFGSPSRFTSLFRRETGVTPSRYRALFR